MKYCDNCGSQVLEGANVCMICGCQIETADAPTGVQSVKTARKSFKLKNIWIILSAVALLLGTVAAILFVPRDLKLKDIKQTNVVSAIIRYGLPEEIRTDDDGELCLDYGDKVDFYGITPTYCVIRPEENRVVFFFSSEDQNDVYEKIERHCDFEENLLDIWHEFNYGDLYITTRAYDGSYVSIEID